MQKNDYCSPEVELIRFYLRDAILASVPIPTEDEYEVIPIDEDIIGDDLYTPVP